MLRAMGRGRTGWERVEGLPQVELLHPQPVDEDPEQLVRVLLLVARILLPLLCQLLDQRRRPDRGCRRGREVAEEVGEGEGDWDWRRRGFRVSRRAWKVGEQRVGDGRRVAGQRQELGQGMRSVEGLSSSAPGLRFSRGEEGTWRTELRKQVLPRFCMPGRVGTPPVDACLTGIVRRRRLERLDGRAASGGPARTQQLPLIERRSLPLSGHSRDAYCKQRQKDWDACRHSRDLSVATGATDEKGEGGRGGGLNGSVGMLDGRFGSSVRRDVGRLGEVEVALGDREGALGPALDGAGELDGHAGAKGWTGRL